MKKQGKRTLTPKLRFPEFRDSEGWQTPRLSDLYSFKQTNTLSRDKLNYETGTIKNIHYGDIHTKFKPLFRVDQEYVPFINPEVAVNAFEEKDDCEEGDIVLADASEDLNDIGKAIEVVSLDGQRIVAGMHTILATRYESVPIIGFGGYLFQSAAVRARIQRESQGTKVYGISANRIATITLPLPPTIQEQQKIADCLSSLDNLIAAEGRKLEALRNHKRGLMQQLFPREGETVPQLRFPEFRDKPRWENKTLGEVADYENGKAHEQDIDEHGKYIVVNSRFISTEGKVIKYSNSINLSANKDDILMVLSDVPNGRAIAKCFLVDEDDKYTVNQRICKITAKSAVSVLLFYILDRNTYFLSFDDGVKQTNLKKEDVLQCPIMLPKDEDEQHRIADCLSSLDKLIAAQAAKLDTLRTHKHGLMQQLFPAPEEQ